MNVLFFRMRKQSRFMRCIFASVMLGCGYTGNNNNAFAAVEWDDRSAIEPKVADKRLSPEVKNREWAMDFKIEVQRIAFLEWHKFYSPLGQKIQAMESGDPHMEPRSMEAPQFRNRPLFRLRKLGPKRHSNANAHPLQKVHFRHKRGVVAYRDLAPQLSLSDINRYQFRRNRRETLTAPVQAKRVDKGMTSLRYRLVRRKL